MKDTALKKEKKSVKKDQIHLPSKGLYNFALPILRAVIVRRYNVTIDRKGIETLESPFVVLSNHCSRIDWILVGLAVWPKYVNVVISRYYYSIPALRVVLRKMGTIPKDQFSPDVAAVKSMLAAAKLGGNVMLFPEGRMTPGGQSETFERSTVKLLRHLKLPIVGINIDGAYLTWPKWAEKMRRGAIDVKADVMLTPEKMAEMTDDEVYEYMVNYLKTDEYIWQDEHRVPFKGKKFAEGLENTLFRCPKCGAEHRMTAKKNVIRCLECGNGAKLDKYYDLHPLTEDCVIPENIGVWYTQQKEILEQHIAEHPDTFMEDECILKMTTDKTWLKEVGTGKVRADASGLTYTGTQNGEPFELFVPIAMMPAMAFSCGKSFELYYQGEFYSFEPTRGVEAQRWSMFVELMHAAQESK